MLNEETLVEDIENEEISYRYEITSYGADYLVDGIVKRIKDEVIYVPSFQRKYVWNITQASKFIESLILGLPVPGIFLSKENKTGKLLIVDGQQRLLSLSQFYKGEFKGREFVLTGLNSNLNGKTYKTLNSEDKIRLDDSIIHATIVRQDRPDDEESSIYLIFERLNTGGKPLTSQEIRACIYYGQFNEFLSKMQKLPNWRTVFGKTDERMKEEELILRFFALFFERGEYTKPLKGFMNMFMSKNRNFQKYNMDVMEEIFVKTINVFAETIEGKSFRIGGPLNAAAFDGCMLGVAERLKKGPIDNKEAFVKAYHSLIENPTFIEKVKGGTSDEKQVKDRIQLAIEQFDNI